MVKLKNPLTGKMEEVDDYYFFDVKGRFPQHNKKNKNMRNLI